MTNLDTIFLSNKYGFGRTQVIVIASYTVVSDLPPNYSERIRVSSSFEMIL
jgi:hypothetical protein